MNEEDLIAEQIDAVPDLQEIVDVQEIHVPAPVPRRVVLTPAYIQQLITTCKIRDSGARGHVAPCLSMCNVRHVCMAQPGAVGAPPAYVAAAAADAVQEAPMDATTQRSLAHVRGCLDNNQWGCVLYTGDYGTGKTHSANRVAAELEQYGGWVSRWLTCSTLDTDLRAVYNQPDRNVDQLLRPYIEAPFLVVDGFGDHNTLRRHAMEALETILLARYDAGRPVLITTNLTPAQLRETLQPATFDRIRQRGISLTFDGASRRAE